MFTRDSKTTKINGTIEEEGNSKLSTGGWVIIILIGLGLLGAIAG